MSEEKVEAHHPVRAGSDAAVLNVMRTGTKRFCVARETATDGNQINAHGDPHFSRLACYHWSAVLGDALSGLTSRITPLRSAAEQIGCMRLLGGVLFLNTLNPCPCSPLAAAADPRWWSAAATSQPSNLIRGSLSTALTEQLQTLPDAGQTDALLLERFLELRA